MILPKFLRPQNHCKLKGNHNYIEVLNVQIQHLQMMYRTPSGKTGDLAGQLHRLSAQTLRSEIMTLLPKVSQGPEHWYRAFPRKHTGLKCCMRCFGCHGFQSSRMGIFAGKRMHCDDNEKVSRIHNTTQQFQWLWNKLRWINKQRQGTSEARGGWDNCAW